MNFLLQFMLLCCIAYTSVYGYCQVKPDKVVDCYSRNDPHIKTFDNLYYDFHREDSYVFFTNDDGGTLVATSFEKCNPLSTATCNCGIHIKHKDTILRSDYCGVVPDWESMELYYDTTTDYGQIAGCDEREVPYNQRFNDLWWETPNNPVNINNELLCAQIEGTNNIIVRTTDPEPKTIYVIIYRYSWGIFELSVRLTTYWWQRTFGLCGCLDGSPENDFRTRTRNYDPNIESDVDIVANYWRYRIPYCPCDASHEEDEFTCQVPTIQCTRERLSLTELQLQDSVRDANAIPTTREEAILECNNRLNVTVINDSVKVGIATKELLDSIRQACVFDFQATGDPHWSAAHVSYLFEFIRLNADRTNQAHQDVINQIPSK